MKVLIVSPFKTGTFAIHDACKRAGIKDVRREHLVRDDCPADITHVVTMVRSFPEQCVSAFFMDIDQPGYEYHFGPRRKVLAAPLEALFAHFKSVDWHSFYHLNYRFTWDQVKKRFGADLRLNVLPQSAWGTGKRTRAIALYIDHPNEELSRSLSLFFGRPVQVKRVHEGRNRWYKHKYAEFKRRYMPQIRRLLKRTQDPLSAYLHPDR